MLNLIVCSFFWFIAFVFYDLFERSIKLIKLEDARVFGLLFGICLVLTSIFDVSSEYNWIFFGMIVTGAIIRIFIVRKFINKYYTNDAITSEHQVIRKRRFDRFIAKRNIIDSKE